MIKFLTKNPFTSEHVKMVKKLAELNPKFVGAPFGACVYYKRRYYYASNLTLGAYNPTAHAEMEAIQKACKAEKTSMLVGGQILSSGEPCPMCLSAIAWSGIKDVYYIDSYKVANKKGYTYDQSAIKTNKILDLGLSIKKI